MLDILKFIYYKDFDLSDGQIAQLVERRTENPCVGGSIPSLATNKKASLVEVFLLVYGLNPRHCRGSRIKNALNGIF